MTTKQTKRNIFFHIMLPKKLDETYWFLTGLTKKRALPDPDVALIRETQKKNELAIEEMHAIYHDKD